jgi:hypothetical protein
MSDSLPRPKAKQLLRSNVGGQLVPPSVATLLGNTLKRSAAFDTGSSASINQVLPAPDVQQDDDRAANGISDPLREWADR